MTKTQNNIGLLPPQATDLEEAVLGAILIDTLAIHEIVQFFTTSEAFYNQKHVLIFEAIMSLYKKNESIDILTVSNNLRKKGKLEIIGGETYLIQLTQKVSSSAHLAHYCLVLLEKFIKRKTIHISSELITRANSDDTDALDLLEISYKEFGKIEDFISNKATKNFKDSIREYFETKEKSSQGAPSSIEKINQTLNGYQDTDLVILAARPGAGKTALALNEAIASASKGFPVAIFSLEMGINQLIGRLLSILSGIEIKKIIHNNLSYEEKQKLQVCAKKLEQLPIEIDDSSGISPLEFKIKLSKLKKEKGIKLVIIDYLQLMRVKDKKSFSREQEVSEISGSLKAIAKELNVPIIALSQLSRSVETRGGSKRPLLSDLRDSGAIEQDADIVMFIYRPEYYKMETWDDDEGSSCINQAEIEIAKHRNGDTGFIRVGCKLKYMQFMDLDVLFSESQPRHITDNFKDTPFTIPQATPEEAF